LALAAGFPGAAPALCDEGFELFAVGAGGDAEGSGATGSEVTDTVSSPVAGALGADATAVGSALAVGAVVLGVSGGWAAFAGASFACGAAAVLLDRWRARPGTKKTAHAPPSAPSTARTASTTPRRLFRGGGAASMAAEPSVAAEDSFVGTGSRPAPVIGFAFVTSDAGVRAATSMSPLAEDAERGY